MLFSKIRKLLGDKPNTLPDENDNFICATKFQHFFKDKIIKIKKNIDEERKELTKENKCEPCSSCMYTGEPMTVFKTLDTDDLINSTCKEKSSNVIKFVDALKAFKDKLANCAMFGKLDMLLDSKQKKIDIIKTIKLI